MKRFLVHKTQEGSTLTLGELPDHTLAFQQEGKHEHPRVVGEIWGVLWVTVYRKLHVVCAGDSPVDGADCVVVKFPHRTQRYPVRDFAGHRGVWMGFPEPFEHRMVITAQWIGSGRVLAVDRWQDDSSAYAPLLVEES